MSLLPKFLQRFKGVQPSGENRAPARAKTGCARGLAFGAAGLVILCLALTAVSTLVNRSIPAHAGSDRLSAVDQARLAEVFHLRRTLGDAVMPGWAQAEIPVILYNEETLFLVGLADPAAGWSTVPRGERRGGEWELVPDDEFLGLPTFRQPIPASGETTQAFTVRVGEHWVASMATYEWMRIALARDVRADLPPALRELAPYGIMVNLLAPGSETQIGAVLHESMHAYQGIRAAERLNQAEQTTRAADRYPWEDEAFRADWQTELDLLHKALRAKTDEEALNLAREFLAQREMRRKAADLPKELAEFERAREWEEGIAKYAELSIYRLASQTASYQPVPELVQDPAFREYRGAERKWNQEVDQIRLMSGAEGDGRFYYTGFAQAVLLDRLSPGWKDRLFEPGVWLEDLLDDFVNPTCERQMPCRFQITPTP